VKKALSELFLKPLLLVVFVCWVITLYIPKPIWIGAPMLLLTLVLSGVFTISLVRSIPKTFERYL
jgi:hypothetical protein